MRTFLQAILAVSLIAGSVVAAEKQTFLDGVVTVEVPSGWKTETDEQQLAMSVIHETSPVTRVIFSTPNLNTKGDPAVSYECNLDLMYMFFGSDLNIISENDNATLGGKTGMQMDYSAHRDGRDFRGRMFSYAAGEITVLCIAISTEADFSTYENDLTSLIQSYTVNQDAVKANRQMLQIIADRADALYNELVEDLEESYEEAPAQ